MHVWKFNIYKYWTTEKKCNAFVIDSCYLKNEGYFMDYYTRIVM